MVLFSLTMIFQISPVYAAVDRAFNANNLSWYLAYIALAVGLYIVTLAIQAMLDEPVPSWVPVLMIIVTTLLTTLYIGWILHSPEWNSLEHIVPRSPADLAFMLTQYVYCALLTTIPARAFIHHYRHNANTPANKYRLGTLAVGSVTVVFYFTGKSSLALLGYFHLPTTIPYVLTKVAMPVAGLAWPLAYVPVAWIARPLNYVNTILTLLDVRRAYEQLVSLCPYVPKHHQPPFLWQLAEPRLYTLLYVAGILDARKALSLYLQEQRDAPEIERWLVRLQKLDELENTELLQKCRTLTQPT